MPTKLKLKDLFHSIAMSKYDIIVKNGIIVDGTGRKPFKGSIAIKENRIICIGEIKGDAEIVIDARGLIVAPGFIDIHSHADETLWLYPHAPSLVLQGVTTIVGGNCGFSPAPLRKWWLLSFWELDWWHEIRPFKYYPEIIIPLDDFIEEVRKRYGIEVTWRSFGDYLMWLEEKGISVNYVPLVGHNTVRAQVMGPDYRRKAREKELYEMKMLIEEAMRAGAFGMSTGLDYEPGAYADIEEIVELAKVVSKYGGIYATHWRRTGVRKERPELQPPEKIKGILEAIEIGRRAKVAVQISHIMSGYTIRPPPPPGLASVATRVTIKVLEEARKEGLDIQFDVIPTTSGGVFTFSYLAGILAPWAREHGSREALAKALRIPEVRQEIKEAILRGKWWYINPRHDPYWADRLVIIDSKDERWRGRSIASIAKELGKDSLDTLFDLIMDDPDIKGTYINYVSEAEVMEFVKYKDSMICSDTFTLDFKWELKAPPYFLPHPNTYGVFPYFIRRYVKELRLLSLEEAIMKITSLPAKRMHLLERGIVKERAYADIVIFDLEELRDQGDLIEPRRKPRGIEYVLVNGVLVVKEGELTGARPGKVLRRDRDSDLRPSQA
ncbi:MAG: hypothetical protein DRM97_05480 [Thermoprotei archaeon]|nr:MAG: hypothetical protein DRM97_05480 [Thermoprotei archaeon]